ncbi:PHD-type domain-containing protein [Plasmodiophora brassicae]
MSGAAEPEAAAAAAAGADDVEGAVDVQASGSVQQEADVPAAVASSTSRPRRERRPAALTEVVQTASTRVRGTRGRGRPRGRPPRRGGRPLTRVAASIADDASETSDTSRGAYGQNPADMVHGNELYCVCLKPYQADKFMIGCDQCDGWFHPDCVNITTQQAMRMQSYTCPKCATEGAMPKKRRKRGVLTMPPMMSVHGGKPYSSLMSPETLKRRMAAVRELASRLSDDLVSGPEVPALDTDVELSSDEGEGRTLFDPDTANDDFGFSSAIPGDDVDARDRAIIVHLKRRRTECEVVLQTIRIYQGLVNSGLEFARHESLMRRFEHLAEADISIVERTEPLYSALCLACKGDIPLVSFAAHLEECLEAGTEVRCSRALTDAVIKDGHHHHLDDSWIEEDDDDRKAPLLVCGYPFALARMRFSTSLTQEDVSDLTFCDAERNDCVKHVGWQEMATAELLKHEHAQRRRARRLDIELIDIDRRVTERQKHQSICRDIANPAIPLEGALAPPPVLPVPQPVVARDTSSSVMATVGADFQARAAAAQVVPITASSS